MLTHDDKALDDGGEEKKILPTSQLKSHSVGYSTKLVSAHTLVDSRIVTFGIFDGKRSLAILCEGHLEKFKHGTSSVTQAVPQRDQHCRVVSLFVTPPTTHIQPIIS